MYALLIDSDKAERETLRDHLTKKGFKVTASEGGLSLLDDMSNFKKDMVVLDYNTWRSNRGSYRYFGVEKMWTGVPVVVLSHNRRSEVFKERHPSDKDAIIGKPVNMNEFDEAINNINASK